MSNELEKKRLSELALRAVHSGKPQFTRFLEPSAERDVRAAAVQAGADLCFFGGYDDAERKVAAFFGGPAPAGSDYPIAALLVEWNAKFSKVQHRDLMGACMHLGLEREVFGDICMGEASDGGECAYLFVMDEMADYIASALETAGRARLRLTRAETIRIRLPEGTPLRVTVQNLRLDAVLAAALKLSRSEAQRLIASGLVKLNHVPEERSDARIAEGDLISARGHGRILIDQVQGETRKGRIGVGLLLYGK